MNGYNQCCESICMLSDLSSSSTMDHLNLMTDNNSSSLSDAGTHNTNALNTSKAYKDVTTIMLASSNPKKRTGRKKFKETRHPVYRGVRMRNSNRWVCEVREPNKRNRIWLGTYPTAEMAARAHDVAALALRGVHGCLNFADSAWRLPKPVSSNPEDIQRAAAEAAAMFSNDKEEEDASVVISTCTTTTTNIDKNTCNGEFCYMEDEVMFDDDMPGLMNDMAEGLLLSPPPPPPPLYMNGEYTWDMDNVEDYYCDMNLWNHQM